MVKPNMQRRHFIFLARIINRMIREQGYGEPLVYHFMAALADTNSSFDADRFIDECLKGTRYDAKRNR